MGELGKKYDETYSVWCSSGVETTDFISQLAWEVSEFRSRSVRLSSAAAVQALTLALIISEMLSVTSLIWDISRTALAYVAYMILI